MEDVFATSGSSRGATRRAAEPLVAPDTTSARLTAPARKSDDKRAKQLDELRAIEKKQYVDPVTFAAVQGALGEMDDALCWYEKAFEDRTPNMVYALMGHRFAPEVAGSLRYKAIVERMGFPKSAR